MTLVDSYMSTWEHERAGYVKCRTLGHSWDEYDDSTWTPEWGTPLSLRCERCGTVRRDIIDARGDLSSRNYVKPTGYDLTRDDYKPTRSDFRLVLLAAREHAPAPARRSRK